MDSQLIAALAVEALEYEIVTQDLRHLVHTERVNELWLIRLWMKETTTFLQHDDSDSVL